ncbi:MAG: NrsF family protein [Steroidobacteraceae bacterium]
MQTDELIASLTHELPTTQPNALARLLITGLLIGATGTLLIFFIGYGVRVDLNDALISWPFWMKLTYALSIGLIAYLLCERAARPANKLGRLALLPLLPLGFLAVLSVRTQMALPESVRIATWLGHSSLYCPWNIGLLSLPVFAALCCSLRRAAPTRLRTTGFVAGLLAGAIAALAYGFFCQESSIAFVSTWYTLGMLLPATVGAIFGNSLLRWS